MGRCHICLQNIKNLELKSHYDYCHSNITKYVCLEGGCYRSYDNLIAFVKHVHNKHNDVEIVPNISSTIQVPVSLPVVTNSTEETCIITESATLINEFNSSRKVTCENFISKLYSNSSIPETKLQTIIQDVSELCESTYLNNLKNLITKICVQNRVDSKVNVVLHDIFNKLEKPLLSLSTQYKVKQNFEQSNFYNAPKPYVIGTKLARKKVKKIYHRKIVQVHGQYVPLKNSLKMLLELPNCFEIVESYIDSLENDENIVKNIMQSALWKKKWKILKITK